jgi:hypothetical protein
VIELRAEDASSCCDPIQDIPDDVILGDANRAIAPAISAINSVKGENS